MATSMRLPVGRVAGKTRTRRSSPVGRVVDFLSDWGVAGFAAWTLLCYLAILTHAPVMAITIVWLCVLPVLAYGLYRLRPRAPETSEVFRTARVDRYAARVPRIVWCGLAVPCAGVAGALAAVRFNNVWILPWLFAAVAVAVAVCVAARRPPHNDHVRQWWCADLIVVGIGLALATLSLMVFTTDGDDTYYVNRAVATAQLGHIPTSDVIFTHQALPPIAGAGLPLGTMEVLQGAMARLIGVSAGSIAYYVTPPVGTFLAVWALWRLLRTWAPRRVLACFFLGCVYLLFSGAEPYSFGNFFLTRMWQGKVVFVAWLVPVLYTYLTSWARQRNARTGTLLMVGGVAGLGLTASATFAFPLVMAAGSLGLLVRREWRSLAVPIAAAAFPFVVGFIATRLYPVAPASTGLHPIWEIYQDAMNFGVVGAIGGLALWTAPWLARSGAAARVVAGIGAISVVLLTPGLFTLITETQGLGETLWRTLWAVPGPALVGLLAAVPSSRLAPWSGVVPGAAAAALLIGFGHPIWNVAEVHVISRPGWKTQPTHLRQARDILDHYDGPGTVLAPYYTMRAISLITVRTKAVNARSWYAELLPEAPSRTRERFALTDLVEGRIPHADPDQVRKELADLNVGAACVRSYRPEVAHFIEHVGPYHYAFRIAGVGKWHPLICVSSTR